MLETNDNVLHEEPRASEELLASLEVIYNETVGVRQRLHKHKERLLGHPEVSATEAGESPHKEPRGFVDVTQLLINKIGDEISQAHQVLNTLDRF